MSAEAKAEEAEGGEEAEREMWAEAEKAEGDEQAEESSENVHAVGLTILELLAADKIVERLSGSGGGGGDRESAGVQRLPHDLFIADKVVEESEQKSMRLWIGQTRADLINAHVPLVRDRPYRILDEHNRIWQLTWQEETRSFLGWMWPKFLQANDIVQGDRIEIYKVACQNRLRIVRGERPQRNRIHLTTDELVVYNRSQQDQQKEARLANLKRQKPSKQESLSW